MGDRHSAEFGGRAVQSPPCREAGRGNRGLRYIVKLLSRLRHMYKTQSHAIPPKIEIRIRETESAPAENSKGGRGKLRSKEKK